MNSAAGAVAVSRRSVWSSLALLWLAGLGLRLTLLAVPPVIPLIHSELHLSEAEIGTLGTLPALLFAAAAIPGSLLIARFGATAALITGLMLVGLGSAARGAAQGIGLLYVATMVTSAGVAIMQPSLPPLVRAWLPQRVPLATAVYTNGLLVAETAAVALTLPLVLPLAGGSWRLVFVYWGVPVVAIAIVIALFAPRPTAPVASTARRWWPNWRDKQLWRLALCLGCINTCYFATNTFLPDYLHAVGRADLVSAALTALNFCQLPASFLMLGLAPRLVRRHGAYVATGAASLVSIIGLAASSGWWIVFWSGVLGFAGAVGLILVLALPPLLSAPDDVHRLASAMFTISYPCAVLISIAAGLAWDRIHLPWVAFVPIGFCALVLSLLPLSIDFREARP
ncbi:MAG TPA: MFS transporter [Stellaceae bacterium]|nr:MFS transporter [Stellaceae bacterium]